MEIFILASRCSICLILLLVPHYSHIGSIICVVITESIVTLIMGYYLYRKGIYIWTGKILGEVS